MSLFKGKKGVELSLRTIIQLVLILVFVFFPLWEFVLSDHYKLFERRFVSKDLSLLIDTLYAAPGDVYYTYEQDVTGLGYNFSENKAFVLYEFVDVFNYPRSGSNFLEDDSIDFEYSQFVIKNFYSDVPEKDRRNYKITPFFIKRADSIKPGFGGFIPSQKESLIKIPVKKKIEKTAIACNAEGKTGDIACDIAGSLKRRLSRDVEEGEPARLIMSLDESKIKSYNPDFLLVLEVEEIPPEDKRFEIVTSSNKKIELRQLDSFMAGLIKKHLKAVLDDPDIATDIKKEEILDSTDLSVKVLVINKPEEEHKTLVARGIYNAIQEFNKGVKE